MGFQSCSVVMMITRRGEPINAPNVCCWQRRRHLGFARSCRPIVSDIPDNRALVAAFSAIGHAPRASEEDALRQAVCDYVVAAKSAGMTPEQIIIAIRSTPISGGDILPSIMQKVIDWCLDRYFDR
jgi:hypothetical protein